MRILRLGAWKLDEVPWLLAYGIHIS